MQFFVTSVMTHAFQLEAETYKSVSACIDLDLVIGCKFGQTHDHQYNGTIAE